MIWIQRTPTDETFRLRQESITDRRKLFEVLARPNYATVNTELVESRTLDIRYLDYLRLHIELIDMEEFQNFIFSDGSAKILIQGLIPEHRIQGVPIEFQTRGGRWPPEVQRIVPHPERFLSGMSELGRIIRQVIEKTTGVLCLNFYCGMHLTEPPLARGGQGMIRSLIAQLVADRMELSGDPNNAASPAKEYFDMTSLNQQLLQNVLRDPSRAKFEDLCNLFVELVCQLPIKSVLVCIIDGINHYEDEEYDDTYDIVLKLIDMVERKIAGVDCVVKLLLMSPRQLKDEWQPFQEENWLRFDLGEHKWIGAKDS